MIPRLVQRRLAHPALRLVRPYASEASTAAYPAEKGGSAKVWIIALASMAGMVGWTELDRRITDNGKKEHPIAAFIDGLRTDSETWTSRSAKHFELVKEAIDDYMVFSTTKRPHMYRLRDPLSFERASPFAVPVGSEVDLSDLRVRTDTTI